MVKSENKAMHLEGHPLRISDAQLTIQSWEEHRIITDSLNRTRRLRDYLLRRQIVHFRAAREMPIELAISRRQLGRIAVGIERNLDSYLEVGGNFDDYRPGPLYETATTMRDQINAHLNPPPPTEAKVLPFRQRHSKSH